VTFRAIDLDMSATRQAALDASTAPYADLVVLSKRFRDLAAARFL
jgi:hypothetical protein